MSLQWTFVATFLYAEIFLVILLLLPWISASRWQKIFKSRLLKNAESHAYLYFNILIFVLVILFMDAIRDVRNYSTTLEPSEAAHHPQAEMVMHMKLFRSQRNFYIAGFALFLWLVLKRLVVLTTNQANLEAQAEASMKQAKSASDAAKRMLEERENNDNSVKEDQNKMAAVAAMAELEKERDQALSKLEQNKEEVIRSKKDLESMRRQAEATNNEYDRLTDEHANLQKKYNILQGGEEESKKDD